MPPLLAGILLGLGAAVPIGPVNVEIARRTLRHGYWRGVAIGAGASTVDMAYALLVAMGLRLILESRTLMLAIGLGGAALLAWLGVRCLLTARQAMGQSDDLSAAVAPASLPATYLTGLAMTSLNPMTLAFWFVAVPAHAAAVTGQSPWALWLLCTGVFVGAASWVVFFAGLLTLLGRWRRPWWLAAADLCGGVLLLAFATVAAAGVWQQVSM